MFDNLKFFVDIVENKNITKTAKKYCMNQSTLSAKMRAIEKEAGTDFFRRSGRNIVPTVNGLMFYEFAKEFLAKYALVEAKMTGDMPQGSELTICTSFDFNNYFLPKILRKFEEDVPFVKLNAKSKVSDDIIPDIENKEYDLAIIASSHPIKAPNLYTDFAYEVSMIGVCSPDNPLAEKSIQPRELEGETILMTTPSNNLSNYLNHVFRKHKMKFAKEINVDSLASVKSFIKENLGVAFIPQHGVLAEFTRNELAEFWVEGVEMSRKMYGIHNVERPPTMITQEFIEDTIRVIDEDRYFKRVQE